jgi:predicted Zn-dependent protease
MSKVRTRLRVEALEGREVPAATGFPWGNAGHLTLSFAPHGTDVAGRQSDLNQTFFNAPDYQRDILRAFQTWAVQANINVAVQADGGDQFGAPGARQGDARFGDIRIGAAPTGSQELAVAAPNDPFLAGTWSGDVVFDADTAWGETGPSVFGVALHEAGHVFGLDHSVSGTSVMYPRLGNDRSALSAADVRNLRTLYGVRAADPYERGQTGNNLLRTATRMDRLPDADFDGDVPLAVFGDLRTVQDVDYYAVVIPDRYDGPVTFRLQTAGVSLLNPSLTILDGTGRALRPGVSSTRVGGDVVEVTLTDVVPGRAYYMRVDGATGDVFGVGGYALAVTLDDELKPDVTPERIDAVLRGPYQSLGQHDLQYLFEDPAYLVNADGGTNDTPGSATRLVLPRGFNSPTHAEYLGSLAGPADVDSYAVRTPAWARPAALTATVWVQDATAAPPELRITDRLGNPVAFDILANGNGTYTVQVARAAANRDYFVTVSGAVATNYALAVDLTTRPAPVATFATGTMTDARPNDARALYVAQGHVFDYVLSATGPAGSSVQMIVYDKYRPDPNSAALALRRRFTLTAGAGETVSGPAAFLEAGNYVIVFVRQGGATGYLLRGAGLTTPIGPIARDQSGQPVFTAPGSAPRDPYVYPGDLSAYDPYLAGQLQNQYGIPVAPTSPLTSPDAFLIMPVFIVQ